MSFWKDDLAHLILNLDYCDYSKLVSLQELYPQLRVKTIDASGKVPVVCFDGKCDWQKPKEWAQNHKANIRQLYEEARSRIAQVTGDNSYLNCLGSSPCQTIEEDGGDNAEVQTLQAENERLLRNFVFAMRLAKALSRGETLTTGMKYLISKFDPDAPIYIVE